MVDGDDIQAFENDPKIPDFAEQFGGLDDYKEFLQDQQRQEEAAAENNRQLLSNKKGVVAKRGVGRFVKPDMNIWAAHHALISNPNTGLEYNPGRYPYFDRVVSQKYTSRAFGDPSHPKFHSYGDMCDNMATIRNFLLVSEFDDGKYDKADFEDQLKAQRVANLAEALGKGLENDRALVKNPFAMRIDRTRASIPGEGAQYMYRKLQRHVFMHNAAYPVAMLYYTLKGQRYQWLEMPPMHQSPFSDGALKAGKKYVARDLEEVAVPMPGGKNESRDPMQPNEQLDEAINLASTGITAAATNNTLNELLDVDALDDPTKERSVEIAKDILKKLKVTIGEIPLVKGLMDLPDQAGEILGKLNEALGTFEQRLAMARAQDGAIMADGAVQRGVMAANKLSYQLLKDAQELAVHQGDAETVQFLEQTMGQMPDSWKDISPSETFGQHLDDVALGLNAIEARMEVLGQRDTFGQGGRGLADHMAIGAHNDQDPKNKMRKAASMEHFEQYQREQAARKSAQQAAMRAQIIQNQRNQRRNQDVMRQRQQQQQQKNAKASMASILNEDQIAAMRKAVSNVTPGAAAVTANRVQENVRREKSAKQQRDMQNKLQSQQKGGRSSHDMQNQKELQPPPHKRHRDHTR